MPEKTQYSPKMQQLVELAAELEDLGHMKNSPLMKSAN